MHGEVAVVDREFNFSQAISSIEVKKSDRGEKIFGAAALIPGFVAEKVNELRSAGSADSNSQRDKFGTGDFAEEVLPQPANIKAQS